MTILVQAFIDMEKAKQNSETNNSSKIISATSTIHMGLRKGIKAFNGLLAFFSLKPHICSCQKI